MIPAARIYEAPKAGERRILVDRLWPRGVTKEAAQVDIWVKEIAPSTELRRWFHTDPEKRFAEFERRYLRELTANRAAAVAAKQAMGKGAVLVTAAKDIAHSHVPTLQRFLTAR